jgi:hypothetical protein
MNVEIGTETLIFLFWEYLFRNIGILSLQCREQKYQYIYFLCEKRADSIISLINIYSVIFLVKNEENICPGSKVLYNEKQGWVRKGEC